MNKHLLCLLITLLSLQFSFAQCDNVTSSGSIAANQIVCANNPDPDPILNTELPQGGSGNLEFLWISTTQNPSAPNTVWFPIPNSTEDSYNPESISQTTYYRRCSRRAGCSEYIGESNIVTIEYSEECMDACDFFKVTVISVSPADCSAENGAVNLSIVAGILPLSYSLNGEILTDLPDNYSAGSYNLTVTDAEGCTDNTSFVITGTEQPIAAVGDVTNPTCQAQNGSIHLTISGGSGNYTAIWNDGNTDINRMNLAEGIYTVLVSDENGCSTEKSFLLTTTNENLEASLDVTNVTCNGENNGSVEVNVLSGTPPYFFILNEAVVLNLNNLSAGNYILETTDITGCSTTNEFTIFEPSPIEIAATTTNSNCGGSNGSIILEVTGGTPNETENYAIEWNTGNGNNLSAGNYTVTATDENGCFATATFTLTSSDSDLNTIILTTPVNCYGSEDGTADITITGGTAPFSYLLNGEEIMELPLFYAAGMYNLVITDSNNCSIQRTFNIEPQQPLTISATSNNPDCSSSTGNINLTVVGGIPPYQYLWSNGATSQDLNNIPAGNYFVTVTDINICSVSEEFIITPSPTLTVNIVPSNTSCNGADDGEINMSFTSGTPPFSYILNGQSYDNLPSTLPADDYQLQVFDALGCSDLVEFTIGEPDEIIYLAEQIDADCPDGFAAIEFATVQGGSSTYTYLWSDDVTTLNRDSLTSGTYFLTITDTNECTAVSEPFTIIVPSEIFISADEGDFQNVSCFGEEDGAVDITVSGGTAPYSYFWSNGATTEDIENLAPGDYLLQLADANGCVTFFLAIISNPEELSAISTVTDATCMEEDGVVFIEPIGGTQPYFFAWDNGSTNAEETNLAPDFYRVTVSDFGGCEVVIEVEVGEMDCLQSETGEAFNFVSSEVSPDLARNSIELHWITEAEAIESFFIIQHSQDGNIFNDISGLLSGEGATQTQNEYRNTCLEMAMGTHFFRIRYVDAFGNLRSSETMRTELVPEGQMEFSVSPNPTINEFRINFLLPLDAPAKIKIVNAQGGIVENIIVSSDTLHQLIDLSRYNSGVYFVVVEREGLRRLTKKIVKM